MLLASDKIDYQKGIKERSGSRKSWPALWAGGRAGASCSVELTISLYSFRKFIFYFMLVPSLPSSPRASSLSYCMYIIFILTITLEPSSIRSHSLRVTSFHFIHSLSLSKSKAVSQSQTTSFYDSIFMLILTNKPPFSTLSSNQLIAHSLWEKQVWFVYISLPSFSSSHRRLYPSTNVSLSCINLHFLNLYPFTLLSVQQQ